MYTKAIWTVLVLFNSCAVVILAQSDSDEDGGHSIGEDGTISIPAPGPQECVFTYRVQGYQTQQQCNLAEVERLVASIRADYQSVTQENNDLRAQVESLRADYEGMVETVRQLEEDTSSWREIIAWPRYEAPFANTPNVSNIISPGKSFIDCEQAVNRKSKQGIYSLLPEGPGEENLPFHAYCDEEGWTVIQRRLNGDVDFFRDWSEYASGFGQLSGEFWLGNDNIHRLTSHRNYELRVEALTYSGKLFHTNNPDFSIDSNEDEFTLHIGNMTSGNTNDHMSKLNGLGFSTKDEDNDEWFAGNCADYYRGAFWLNNCGFDLNRRFCEERGCISFGSETIQKSVMKIRSMGSSGRPSTAAAKRNKPKVARARKPKRPKKAKGSRNTRAKRKERN